MRCYDSEGERNARLGGCKRRVKEDRKEIGAEIENRFFHPVRKHSRE